MRAFKTRARLGGSLRAPTFPTARLPTESSSSLEITHPFESCLMIFIYSRRMNSSTSVESLASAWRRYQGSAISLNLDTFQSMSGLHTSICSASQRKRSFNGHSSSVEVYCKELMLAKGARKVDCKLHPLHPYKPTIELKLARNTVKVAKILRTIYLINATIVASLSFDFCRRISAPTLSV